MSGISIRQNSLIWIARQRRHRVVDSDFAAIAISRLTPIVVRSTDILGTVIASLRAGAQLSDNGLKKVRQEDTR
jgi:hypothetical protein